MANSGLSVSRSFLVHTNNQYLRQGPIEVDQLFTGEYISPQVLARLQGMPEVVAELRATLREAAELAIDIGPHCSDPYALSVGYLGDGEGFGRVKSSCS